MGLPPGVATRPIPKLLWAVLLLESIAAVMLILDFEIYGTKLRVEKNTPKLFLQRLCSVCHL